MGSDELASTGGERFYSEPPYLTPNGRKAFRDEIAAFARQVGDELGRGAELVLLHNQSPEHTADSVREASHAVRGRSARDAVTASHDRPPRSGNLSLAGAIGVTAASIGSQTLPHVLDGRWHFAVYAALLLIGIIGLVAMWSGRRTPAPSRPDPADSSRDGMPMDLS